MVEKFNRLEVRAEAKRLGFFSVGIVRAEAVDEAEQRRHKEWLRRRLFAGMDYLNRNTDKRLDPRLLVPGVKTIICVALNYSPAQPMPAGSLQLASYSLGRDYHDVVKQRLHQLAQAMGFEGYRAFCDSAPVLERYWAQRAGLGWIGRNRQLIIPNAGSHFFLGELFVMEEADEYDRPMPNRCGTCHACQEACPMRALDGDFFDAERCLSYQTIENRAELSAEAKASMGTMFYGCDRCQDACPWNRFAKPTEVAEFLPSPQLLQMKRQDWANLSEQQYRELFRHSAVKRAKYEGLKRNLNAVLSEDPSPTISPPTVIAFNCK